MRRRLLAFTMTLIATAASGATFVVSSGADSGPGTLRQAITDANALPGRDAIAFGVTSIDLIAPLPSINSQIDIDGSVAGNRVEIAGLGLGYTFVFLGGSSSSTVQFVRMTRSTNSIYIDTSVQDLRITQNVFSGGIDIKGDRTVLGTVGAGNRLSALYLLGGFENRVAGNSIGFVDVRSGVRPVLTENDIDNILVVAGTDGALIERNRLTSAAPRAGIVSRTPAAAGARTILRENTITNHDPGMSIEAATLVERNVLMSNTRGIDVFANSVELAANRITGGTIAIDLGFDGPTPNDPAPDADTGANNRQNFPVLTAARRSPGALAVSGMLASALSTPYTIEFFSSPASDPKARTFVGSVDVATDATGNAVFQALFTSNVPVTGEVITATATNRAAVATPGNAPNETSELSAPVVVADTPNSDIPTMSAWGLLALAFGLAAVALLRK